MSWVMIDNKLGDGW